MCHQNEGEKQERGKPGRNQGEAPTQEGGEGLHKMRAEGSPRRTVVSGPEEKASRLEKRSQGSQKGGASTDRLPRGTFGDTVESWGEFYTEPG